MMVQFTRVKLTQKEGGMAAAKFFIQMERYMKGTLQKANVAEKDF